MDVLFEDGDSGWITPLKVISQVVGWIYFTAWSISFYPQIILNYKKKSVAGFSLEFALLNSSGFFFYALYSTGGYIFPHLGSGGVKTNDLVFAWHAFAISSIQFSQAFIYDRGSQSNFKLWALIILIVEWLALIVTFFLEGVFDVGDGMWPEAYNTFRLAGYNKALISFVKYLP